MIDNDELRNYIRHGFDPDDLVNALELDIDELIDILWVEIVDRQHKLYFIEREQGED